MQRRNFIKLVGGGVITAAVSGCSDFSASSRSAWAAPGSGEADPRRRWASFAILAPNPHNMQPWRLDLRKPDELTMYIDPSRLLPSTDPFNRQIVIGCGSFLELLRMAAARDGIGVEIISFPEGDPQPKLDSRPIARVRFGGMATADPLFANVLERRTVRTAFDDQAVSESALQRIVQAASVARASVAGTVDPVRVDRLKAIALRGAEIEQKTPTAHRESVELTFIGGRDVAEHPYGISLVGSQIDALRAIGLLTRAKLMEPGSYAWNGAVAFSRSGADTAKGFIWITTLTNTRSEQLSAGAGYMRAGLQATSEGLWLHPWSQTLQEYESMGPALAVAQAALAPDGGRVQMFARLGHAQAPPHAPRRGLAAQMM